MAGWLFSNGQGSATTRKMLTAQMVIVGVVVLIVFVGVKFQRSGQARLSEYTSADGGYRILFPMPPVETCRLVDTDAGKIRFYTIQQRTDDLLCMAGYGDYPMDYIETAPAESILDSMRDRIVQSNAGTLESETRYLLEGLPARRFLIHVDQAALHVLLALCETRQYQAVIVTSQGESHNRRADELLQSMRIFSSDVQREKR
ncbi:MAG: hypothetical protein JW828_03750 [Sedimentisphaerales bacterium]|nr:hypothetical protein [Sedimentisphaerales bacterium]